MSDIRDGTIAITSLASEQVPVVVKHMPYQFREDRPAHWLQRLALFVLRKLGCAYDMGVVTVFRHQVGANGETFMQRLLEAKRALQVGGITTRHIVIGSEDFAEIMREPVARHYFEFDAQYYQGQGRGYALIGCTVHVVPWMRGFVFLPRAPQ